MTHASRPRRLAAALAALTLLLAPAARPASAQPMIEHVPADAVLYMGWSGTDALGPAYTTSRLKAVLDATGSWAATNVVKPKRARPLCSPWVPASACGTPPSWRCRP